MQILRVSHNVKDTYFKKYYDGSSVFPWKKSSWLSAHFSLEMFLFQKIKYIFVAIHFLLIECVHFFLFFAMSLTTSNMFSFLLHLSNDGREHVKKVEMKNYFTNTKNLTGAKRERVEEKEREWEKVREGERKRAREREVVRHRERVKER